MKMPDNYDEAREWAMARIGQRVFRCANGCSCGVCKGIEDKGLVIMDRMHAAYITLGAIAEKPTRKADARKYANATKAHPRLRTEPGPAENPEKGGSQCRPRTTED